ncbi:AraC family transcriptional regulator [Rhodoligotrophos defluvii]|uniref:AraC family transcriptional regulator n=1 Tax=Rhodoligotrophos defluvii TaxID=2561934 RepID=UPI0010C97D78|nr:helix-turn-helix transcriptional regulator [Rhodoligotrophos defluvii]
MDFSYPLSPDPDEAQSPVVGWHHDSVEAKIFPPHRHRRAQLMHVTSGIVVVEVENGRWVVPPVRALWIPAGITHSARYPRGVAMRHLYLEMSTFEQEMPAHCALLQLDGLTKELIKAVAEQPWEAGLSGPGARLIAVLIDRLAQSARSDLYLPTGQDRRVRRVMDALMQDPSDQRSLREIAKNASASERTLARLFKDDTGLTFGDWRQQLRLHLAIERLASGDSIAQVAFDLGYGSPSSFTTMFRKALGVPPARYIKGASADGLA